MCGPRGKGLVVRLRVEAVIGDLDRCRRHNRRDTSGTVWTDVFVEEEAC